MKSIRRSVLLTALALPVASALPQIGWTANAPVPVRMSINDPLVPMLAQSLGYFAAEGLALSVVKVDDVSPHGYLMQEPLVKGQLDVSYHWFHHVVYGQRHKLPVKGVMMVNDAPGMKVLVANQVRDQIRNAADFKGRRIAEGAGYATKSVLMNLLARQAGLPDGSYTPVLKEVDGRLQAVQKGLADGQVDVAAFMEPITSALEASGQVTALYDLTNVRGTTKALGAPWIAHSVFMSDAYIQKNPATVQRIVNVFVRTLRYMNSHSAEDIAAQLPLDYAGTPMDRAAVLTKVRAALPMIARDNYSFSPAAVRLVLDTVLASKYDSSEEGVFRATGDNKAIRAEGLYTNRFVERAMRKYKK
jgi:NitT/TauT family transport system substrate-binding protein